MTIIRIVFVIEKLMIKTNKQKNNFLCRHQWISFHSLDDCLYVNELIYNNKSKMNTSRIMYVIHEMMIYVFLMVKIKFHCVSSKSNSLSLTIAMKGHLEILEEEEAP